MISIAQVIDESPDARCFYRNVLGGTLLEHVKEHLSLSPAEQFDVRTELALVRAHAEQIVSLYGVARLASERAPDNQGFKETMIAAGAVMQQQLIEVMSLADKAARIDAASRDRFSVMHLHHFLDQLVSLVQQCFLDDPEGLERAQRLTFQIREKIRLPRSLDSAGESDASTLLTPVMTKTSTDDVVRAMDSTVPETMDKQAEVA